MIFLQLDAVHAKQDKKCIGITRSFIVHFRHAITQQRDGDHPRDGGVEISNLCNHRVAKQSKAGPPGAESSVGESTMLSAKFVEAIRGKQAEKNSAVPGFKFCVFKTPRTRRSMPRQK